MRKWLVTLLIGIFSVATFSGCMMGQTNNTQSETPDPFADVETVEEVVDVVLEELEYDITYADIVEFVEEYKDVDVATFLDTVYDEYDVDLEEVLAKLQEDHVADILDDIEEDLGNTIYFINVEDYLDMTVGECFSELFGYEFEEDGKEDNSSEEDDDDGYVTVKFELCTELETNKIFDEEVEVGGTVTKPNVVVRGDNPTNAEVEAWYTDADYTKKWSFLMDTVEEDMTLYAKWVSKFSVTYYLGSEENAMYTEQVPMGTMYSVNDDWADGYKCNGFFFERFWNDVTQRYDFVNEVPDSFAIEEDVNIYINRSDEIYFDAEMVANRFKPVAGGGGKDGATEGKLTYVEEDDYTKINFGYSPTVADAHVLLSGVTVDITHSQKLRITMKNLGQADGLKLYFLSWVDTENKIYANGQSMNEACTSYYKYAKDEKGMTEDSEWITVEFDIAKDSIFNGVSMWGTSETLLALRVQSGYISKDETDLSNEIWIKSIEGVADDTYISSDDTAEVKELLVNDAEEDLIAASEAQESVDGFVFPKDRACVTAEEGTSVYNKVNGLLFYGAYLQTEAKFTIRPAEGQIIDLNELTTLNFRLRNYGYATQFTIKYFNKNGRSATKDIVIDASMGEVKDYVINMFMADNYNGALDKIEISYQSVGNDNAILFESIYFSPFVATDIPGFNFVDRYTFGLTSNENMEISFVADNAQSGTQFNVLATGAAFEKAYTQFAINAYTNVVLSYKMENEGITAVKLYLTVDGAETEYVFETSVSDGLSQISLPLTAVGNVTNMRVVFEGMGVIRIREITFQLPETAVNFATSTPQANAGGNKKDWMPTGNYIPDLAATQYKSTPVMNADGTINVDHFRYYPGATGGADKNISLKGKTKLVIIYQNRMDTANFSIAFGLTNTLTEGWEYDIRQPLGDQGTGEVACDGMLANMAANEWAAYEIELSSLRGFTDDSAISCVFFGPSDKNLPAEIYIRAFAFI